jgi:hypothetical protein
VRMVLGERIECEHHRRLQQEAEADRCNRRAVAEWAWMYRSLAPECQRLISEDCRGLGERQQGEEIAVLEELSVNRRLRKFGSLSFPAVLE